MPDAPVRVGELRPSQLLWAFGCGAVVDLPQLSVVVMGLDHWDPTASVPVGEERLLAAVRRTLGPQVGRLLGAPTRPEGRYNPFTPEARIGVPVSPFPRWLRCPLCGRMGEVGSGLFELKADLHRPDRTKFVHANCAKSQGAPPSAVAARFLVACRDGHLDDFPWHFFVHGGQSGCPGPLKFFEQGASLQTENLWVSCERCNKARSMVDAFGDRGRTLMPQCRGRHPHLGRTDEGCEARLRPVLLGASNSWFPVTMSVLAIPTQASRLQQIVRDRWDLLKGITSREVLPVLIEALSNGGLLPGIGAYSHDEIWQAIEGVRAAEAAAKDEQPEDLKRPEYQALSSPNPPQNWPDFMVTRTDAPAAFSRTIDYVVLGERLREVNALIGFTRVEPPDEGRADAVAPERAPLSRGQPTWVPATEVRGEGIFLRFNSARLADWRKRPAVLAREAALLDGHRAFRAARRILPTEANFPGIVYVLLHSFAHVFIRELALESGYSAASVRERIYASGYGEPPEMAGILVYTAAPDSEGTLGGLVELGRPQNLGALIDQALERTRICASDPLCAEHVPTVTDRSLHGAACHACSFVAETSCEVGNRYLDRSLLVPTLAGGELAFFEVNRS